MQIGPLHAAGSTGLVREADERSHASLHLFIAFFTIITAVAACA